MSLRARLVIATCVVALVALAVAGIATYTAFSRSQLRQVDNSLQLAHESIEQAVERGQSPGGDIERAAPGLFVAVLDASGRPAVAIPGRVPGHAPVSADLGNLTLPPATTGEVPDHPTFSTTGSADSNDDVRVRLSRLSDGRVLVLGISLHEVSESKQHLILIESIVAAIALVVAAALSWFLIGIGLRPLRRVEQTALSIAATGDLDHDVPGADAGTEVGHLAGAINTMLDQIRGTFRERDETEMALRASEQRMRQFVADVSHELRTPLAAVSAYAELFERGARDRPLDLERALRGISLESARMHELVEELLLLAHLDEGRPLVFRRVDLDEILLDAVAAARAVSHEWPIFVEVVDVAIVNGDPGRLRQVFDNVLANSRTHTPPGTETHIRVSVSGDQASIVIADDGPGLAPTAAAHVFDRFFRADPSRARSSGGSGLGLAIVHAIVNAHAGTVSVDTDLGRGFAITISIPLAETSSPAPKPVPQGQP